MAAERETVIYLIDPRCIVKKLCNILFNPGNVSAGRAPCVPGGDDVSKVQDCINCVNTHWGKDCKGDSCDFLSQATPQVSDTMVRNFCKYGMRGQDSD